MPIRELENRLYSTISKPQNNQLEFSKQYSMDIETDFIRECSTSPSLNSSIEMFVKFAISSINYIDCIQAQANNITWAEQVKNWEVQSPSLFYMSLKEVMSDTVSMRPAIKSMHVPHTVEINSTNTS